MAPLRAFGLGNLVITLATLACPLTVALSSSDSSCGFVPLLSPRRLLALKLSGPHPKNPRRFLKAGSSWQQTQLKADRDVGKSNTSRKRMGIPKAVPRPGGPAILTRGDSALSSLPPAGKAFTVLGIETSCDDTAVAVLRSDGAILGEAIAKQNKIHEEWGGVVPSLARRAHEEAVNKTISLALEQAFGHGADASCVDAVAATVGPGIEICLRVGATAGRTAALTHQLPFVGVHHLEAHCLIARAPALMKGGTAGVTTAGSGAVVGPAVTFPFLALVISGGHCLLLRVRGVGEHEIMGGTLDDTLGEAYDKCARLFDLPIGGGGGPAVEELAKKGDATKRPLPVPLLGREGCDFSFSGLKQAFRKEHAHVRVSRGLEITAEGGAASGEEEEEEEEDRARLRAEHHIRGFKLDGLEGAERLQPLPEQDKADLAAGFQEAAVRHLEDRVGRAMRACGGDIRNLVVVGGVAANLEIASRLRALCERGGQPVPKSRRDQREVEAAQPWAMAVPPPALCTDNGVMIAWTAVERLALGISDDPRDHVTRPKWPIGDLCRSD